MVELAARCCLLRAAPLALGFALTRTEHDELRVIVVCRGSSTAAALLKTCQGMKVTIASRSKESFDAAVARRPELKDTTFQAVDITDAKAVKVRGAHAPRSYLGGSGAEVARKTHTQQGPCGSLACSFHRSFLQSWIMCSGV